MNNKIILPLKNKNRYFYINEDMLKEKEEELEEFILKSGKMNTLSFAKKVLLFNEVQSNNSVEGYYDDIEKIKKVVNEKKIYKNSQEKDKLRIINLYEGYRYILDNKDITKETLKELNSILSKGLLDDEDYKNMGEYYRKNPVYIYYSSDVTKRPDMGLDASLIEDKMDELLDFMNNYSFDNISDIDRTVYNTFINSGVKSENTNNRIFSTMDYFPTTIAALGATIEGDRLGLGTNLFSEKKTLIEEYGLKYVDTELDKNSKYYNECIINKKC